MTTASAFALFGARIVFADVCPKLLALDAGHVRQLITPRTRAVVTVHYAGICGDPLPLVELCARHGIPLVEDAAHSLGGSWQGRPLGTFGSLGTLSFHESKNFSSGEGGALVINDPALISRAEILREKGTNRSAMLRREVAKYTWMDLGSSYLASDLCAAALLAQLEEYDTIQDRRHLLWNRYTQALGAWSSESGVRLPCVPDGCHHAAHLYYLLFPDQTSRDAAISWLDSQGVESCFHYLPLHLSDCGSRSGSAPLGAPVAVHASGCLLRLPLYPGLSDEQQQRVIGALLSLPAKNLDSSVRNASSQT